VVTKCKYTVYACVLCDGEEDEGIGSREVREKALFGNVESVQVKKNGRDSRTTRDKQTSQGCKQ